jgi:hypothetical protein
VRVYAVVTFHPRRRAPHERKERKAGEETGC